MLLKRELGPKSWPVGADVDADLQRQGSSFLARRCNSRICGEFSSKLASMNATFAPRSGHDHAVIGPQSWVDPRPLASKAAFRSSGRWFRPPEITIAARSRLDRDSIATRSSRYLRVLPEPLDAVRSIIRRLEGHERAIAIHSPRPSDGDPTVLMRRAATCLKRN